MIRLDRVEVRAGDFLLAVDDLSVEAGEYLVVLGPTASGKTVLLETVAGLRRLQQGRVWFGDRDVTTDSPEKRGAGLVYQDYALFSHLSVADNIGFGLHYRARPRGPRGVQLGGRESDDDRVRALAELLGIEGLLARFPETLSGGERQRVALARALAIEPSVLLLDEPLSALDQSTRLELRGQLRRVQRELGATVMHVTHDLDEALALGDRVAVLIEGRIRQVGAPEAVMRAPIDVEVARLTGMINIFPIMIIQEEDGGDSSCPGVAGEAAPVSGPALCDSGFLGRRKRIRLKNGLELVSKGATATVPSKTSEGLFALIRADEVEVQPLRSDDVLRRLRLAENAVLMDGNVLQGKIRAVQVQSAHTVIEVEIDAVPPGGAPAVVAAHVLRPYVEKAGLTVGSRVRVHIPESAVSICAEGGAGLAHSPLPEGR